MHRYLISIFILFLIMGHVWCEGHITVDGNKYELERIYWEKIPGDQYYKVCKNGKYAVVKNDVIITPFKYKDIAYKNTYRANNSDVYIIGVIAYSYDYDIDYEPSYFNPFGFLNSNSRRNHILPYWNLYKTKRIKKGEWITKNNNVIPVSEKYGLNCYFSDYYKVPDFLTEKYRSSCNSFIEICDKEGNRAYYDIYGNRILETLPNEYTIDDYTIFPFRYMDKEDKYGLILPDGKILLECIYDRIDTICIDFGKTEPDKYLVTVRKGDEYGSFSYTKDGDLEECISLRPYKIIYYSIRDFGNERFAIVVRKNKYSVASLTTNKIYFNFKYDGIQWLDEDRNKDCLLMNKNILSDIAITPAFVLYTDIGDNKMNIDIEFLTSTNSR